MNLLLLVVVLVGLLNVAIFHLWDRPEVPAWKGKYAYRLLALVLSVALGLAMMKAMQWHTELLYMNRLCQ